MVGLVVVVLWYLEFDLGVLYGFVGFVLDIFDGGDVFVGDCGDW